MSPFKMKGFPMKSPMKQVSKEKEGDLERGNYTYKLVDTNGNVIKTISKEDYINYQNDPGGDKPTKTTNDPDPYGRKKGGSVTTPK